LIKLWGYGYELGLELG